MEFGWTGEQLHSQQAARQFGAFELTPPAPAPAPSFAAQWQACARFGLLGLNLPPAYGGLGLDARSCAHILAGLGEGCRDNGLLMALGVQLWSVTPPLLEAGSAAQKQAWLPRFCRGEALAAYCLTEAGSGSDALRLRTLARPEGTGFRLNGTKMFVTNAPLADVFLVFATTDPAAGFWGLTAFLLPRSTPGLSVGATLAKMGLETSPMAAVHLDDAWVPESALLGAVGGGGALIRSSLEWERGLLLAPAVGTMARLLTATTAYTRQREQFGRPVADFEAVGHQLAEMRLRLELSRLLLYQFAWAQDSRHEAALAASLAKLYISESYRFVAQTCLHLHGAYGYSKAYEFEQVWRDAMASSLYSGTTEMQKNLIAADGLHAAATPVEAAALPPPTPLPRPTAAPPPPAAGVASLPPATLAARPAR